MSSLLGRAFVGVCCSAIVETMIVTPKSTNSQQRSLFHSTFDGRKTQFNQRQISNVKKTRKKKSSIVETFGVISLAAACVAIAVDMVAPPIATRMGTLNVAEGVADAQASFSFDNRFGSRQAFAIDAVTYASAAHSKSQMFVTGHFDGTVSVWNSVSGELLQSHQAHTDAVEDVALAPSGKLLASGSWDNHIRIWNLMTKQLFHDLAGHTDDVKSLIISEDGNLLVSGSFDKTIIVWDVLSGELLHRFAHPYGITSVAISPDGKTVVGGDRRGMIHVWDLQSERKLITLHGHKRTVWDLAFSPDGTMFISGSQDKMVISWDLQNFKPTCMFMGHDRAVYSVAFSPDGRTIASGSYDHTVKLWDVKTHQLVQTLKGHKMAVWDLAFDHDGNALMSSSADGTVRFWSAEWMLELAAVWAGNSCAIDCWVRENVPRRVGKSLPISIPLTDLYIYPPFLFGNMCWVRENVPRRVGKSLPISIPLTDLYIYPPFLFGNMVMNVNFGFGRWGDGCRLLGLRDRKIAKYVG